MRTSLRGKVRHAGGGVALMPVGGTLDSMAPTWELNEDLCNSRIPHKGRLHSSPEGIIFNRDDLSLLSFSLSSLLHPLILFSPYQI